MREEPKTGEIYKHFKDKLYQIVCVATHFETKEKLVIYQALYGEFGIYARPLYIFLSELDKEKYPDLEQRYRFEKIGSIGEIKKRNDEKRLKSINEHIDDQEKSLKTGDYESSVQSYFMEFLDADDYYTKKRILIANKDFVTDRELDSLYDIYGLKRGNIDRDADIADLIGYLDVQQQFEGKRLRKK